MLFKEEIISPDNLSKQAIIFGSFLCFIFIYLLTYFCSFSEPCTAWSWSVFAVVFSPGKIGDCLERFQLMNDLSHCRMVDFRLSINGQITLPRLMGNNSSFSRVLADIFPAWYYDKTHLNTAVLHPKRLHFLRCSHLLIISSLSIVDLLVFILLIPMGPVRLYYFSTYWLHFLK